MLVFRKLWTMSVKPQGSLSVCPTLSNAALVGQRQPLRLGCCQKYTEEEEEEETHNIKYKKTSGATIKSRFHYHLCEDFKKKKTQNPSKVKFLKLKMLRFNRQEEGLEPPTDREPCLQPAATQIPAQLIF